MKRTNTLLASIAILLCLSLPKISAQNSSDIAQKITHFLKHKEETHHHFHTHQHDLPERPPVACVCPICGFALRKAGVPLISGKGSVFSSF